MIFLCGHAPFFMRPSRNEPYRPVVPQYGAVRHGSPGTDQRFNQQYFRSQAVGLGWIAESVGVGRRVLARHAK